VTGSLSLSGTDSGNYTVNASHTTQANITAKALTGSFTAQNKQYDGTRDATVASRSLDGVISPDTVNLDLANVQFVDKNVGTGKDVTGSLSLSGTDSGNYTVNASHTAKANITAKALTINGLSAQNKVWDGNTNATITGSPSLVGVISPDVVTLTGTATGTFDSANVGPRTVTVSGLTLSGADASNYSLTLPTLSANIGSWTLKGFYQPVDMGIENNTKAGSTVPLKFEVFQGATELTDATAIKDTFTQQVNCLSGVGDDIELYATGGTSLRYDTTGGQFIFNWQSLKKVGACYKVTLVTKDGSQISADFRLK